MPVDRIVLRTSVPVSRGDYVSERLVLESLLLIPGPYNALRQTGLQIYRASYAQTLKWRPRIFVMELVLLGSGTTKLRVVSF